MKLNLEKEKIKNRQAVCVDYEEALRIAGAENTISDQENENWSMKDLEDLFLSSARLAGEASIRDNQGVIYTTLSGGLDSSLMLAFLKKNFPKAEIVTFSMGGSAKHPDIQHARLASEAFKTKHVEIIPAPDEIQQAIAEYRAEFPDSEPKEAVQFGDLDVFLLYKKISQFNPKALIVHDGIDEQMGGYWDHRKASSWDEMKKAFAVHWENLPKHHLIPLNKTSQKFKIKLLFPYLDESLVKFISKIPLKDRVSDKIGKKPMRELAYKYKIPQEIIERSKRGQSGALEIE